jgi:glycosyltransferase involved in cell wall biosynthesis
MKIIFSHPTGNSNVRNALNGLLNHNILHSFHTSLAFFPNIFTNYIFKFSFLKELKRREFNKTLHKFTLQYPFKETGRHISSKFNLNYLINKEESYFSIDSVYSYLDYKVSNYLNKNHNKIHSIYAFEDEALQSFLIAKNYNITKFYELPTGYWKAARLLLNKERESRPDWSMTISNFVDSDNKIKRKDKELELADYIIVASQFTKNTLDFYPQKLNNIKVISYGFPSIREKEFYNNNVNKSLKLLFVGKLTQSKGLANILEAVNFFNNLVELTIVGNTIIKDCKPLNDGLKKHKWIPSLPHNEILELMSNNDILLFPSLFEGFGLVISESMSQGTPVITTNRTAGADFIKHGENGWLVEPGSTKSLINCIQNILDNRELIELNGRNALITAKNRPWSKYSNDLSIFLKENARR